MIIKSHFFRSALKIIGVYILFTSGLMAQTEKIAFEKYGVEEGLPEEFVSSMVQAGLETFYSSGFHLKKVSLYCWSVSISDNR
jgi:hypothetical protein